MRTERFANPQVTREASNFPHRRLPFTIVNRGEQFDTTADRHGTAYTNHRIRAEENLKIA